MEVSQELAHFTQLWVVQQQMHQSSIMKNPPVLPGKCHELDIARHKNKSNDKGKNTNISMLLQITFSHMTSFTTK
jgi:hypothetical protein